MILAYTIVPINKHKGPKMYVDKMHSAAIKAADETMLPQTVYWQEHDGNWFHTNALWMREQLRDAKRNGVHMVVTWLPAGFFN